MDKLSRLERVQKKGLLLKEIGETMQLFGRRMMFKRDLKEQEARLDEFFEEFKNLTEKAIELKAPGDDDANAKP